MTFSYDVRPKTDSNKVRISNAHNDNHRATVRVQRPIYQTEELNDVITYQYPNTSVGTALKNSCSSCRPKKCFLDTVPILKWLPDYNFKQNVMGDVFSGLTVATMHIPHGLAYGLLANVPPIVGIYMGFFPVLVYFILGTSRHVSMGTFAVVCMMTGKTVLEFSGEEGPSTSTVVSESYTPLQVATTLTFTVAVMQMAMYIFRLGIITTLLSDTLVNAFTCAAAFHVVVSQIKDLLGLALPKRNGSFKVLYTFFDIGTLIKEVNTTAILISVICITIIVLNNILLKPVLARRTKIPFPIELVAVVTGTIASRLMSLNEKYSVNIVGTIPTGLPSPDLPAFSLIPSILVDSFVITMVSYTITMSLAFMMSQKHHYEVDANQELLALGCSNCLGSFFSCVPITASLSRTQIQQAVGGMTQIASLVSCLILLFVLLWIGPFFETLPRCVLASIIVVALKPMVLQFLSLRTFWKLSKWDALVWIVTFFTTLIVGIDYGLLAGILVSLINIFIQGQKNYSCLLGVVPDTDLYLDVELYKGIQELPGIKIFHYTGPLNFASKSSFKTILFKKTDFDPLILYTRRKQELFLKNEGMFPHCIILDFTALTYIDPSGVETLRYLNDSYRSVNVTMYICGCSGPVFETLRRVEMHRDRKSKFVIFPTVHDAVLYTQSAEDTEDR